MQIHGAQAHPCSIADVETVELLLFRLGADQHGQRSELFGLHVANVREIVAMPQVAALAGSAAHVLGVVKLRGKVLQVLDLPAMTGCVPASGLPILLVTEVADATYACGVESVEEIVLLEADRIVARQHGATGGIVAAIACLDDTASSARLVQVLDIATLVRGFTA